MILSGDPQNSRDTNLSHCHFVNHTSYWEHSRIKIGRLAGRPGTSCTKTWPKVVRIKHHKRTALCRWAKQQLCFNAYFFGSLFFSVYSLVRTQ